MCSWFGTTDPAPDAQFIDEENKAQREVTRPKSRSMLAPEAGLEPKCPASTISML